MFGNGGILMFENWISNILLLSSILESAKRPSFEAKMYIDKNWLSTIDKRISSWKDTLEDDLKKELDKSPESLKNLEKYPFPSLQIISPDFNLIPSLKVLSSFVWVLQPK